MTERTSCPVCGTATYITAGGADYRDTEFGTRISTALANGTCSQECARTFALVEVGRGLMELLRTMAYPVYYSTPEGGVTPVPPGAPPPPEAPE